jgi:hypothetical protein
MAVVGLKLQHVFTLFLKGKRFVRLPSKRTGGRVVGDPKSVREALIKGSMALLSNLNMIWWTRRRHRESHLKRCPSESEQCIDRLHVKDKVLQPLSTSSKVPSACCNPRRVLRVFPEESSLQGVVKQEAQQVAVHPKGVDCGCKDFKEGEYRAIWAMHGARSEKSLIQELGRIWTQLQ